MALFQIISSLLLLAFGGYHAFKALAGLRKEIRELEAQEADSKS
jgi:ABC-type nickel/cobalt efflux system permease component RcnA